MGITDSIKRSVKGAVTKGAMKVAQTSVGKKAISKAMEKQLAGMPEGPQKEAAKQAMINLQNMSAEEQQQIADKMQKLLGGLDLKGDNMTAVDQMELMKRMRKMTPQERKEYEDLARKMMGM